MCRAHKQELDRKLGFWSICFLSIIIDNAWAAGAVSFVVALYNGGGPGVLYGLITATFFYIFIALSLCELASAIPSSASTYHWSSVTAGPTYGPLCSWFAGWWMVLAWTFGSTFGTLAAANATIAIYALYYPDYQPERWQIFIAFAGMTWMSLSVLLFGQRYLNKSFNVLGVLCLATWLGTLLTCAIMPMVNGQGYATSSFVWRDWNNLTGWSSDGFVFMAGILNGAYAISTPDGSSHAAEEVNNPKRNVPIGVLIQMTTGFLTTFTLFMALLYAITSLDDMFASTIPALPLAAIYQQATQSNAGTAALFVLLVFNFLCCMPGCYIVPSRMIWTMARDNALPFSTYMSHVDARFRNPFRATITVGVASTVLGLIYIDNPTAFNAFAGCFIILITLSYLAAILPHLLTRRRYVKPGPLWMPARVAYPVMTIASAYIIATNVIFMFPYTLPTSVATMIYSVVMTVGLTIVVAVYYRFKRRGGYVGPRVLMEIEGEVVLGSVAKQMREQDVRHQA